MMNAPELVLGITGSIGAYKAGDLVRQLRDAGYGVTCVLTERAAKFIAPATLQILSERRAYVDMFDAHETHVIHTTLAERARLVLIAPATANVIGKFAGGIADDLLSCLLLATRAKILVAPAMNVHMWQHPAVQRNVTTLKRLGYRFIGPDVGKLACGYEAIGHLAEVDDIVRAVQQMVPGVSAASAGQTQDAGQTTRSKSKPKPKPAKRAKSRKR